MDTSFPIWDRTGTFITTDAEGRECWMDETQVRVLIGKQKIGVMREPGSSRAEMKLYWKEKEKPVGKRIVRRLQTGQPNVVIETVGDTHRVYMHHAERCESHYDGRQMPVVKYNHYSRPGTPHKRGSYKINAACL